MIDEIQSIQRDLGRAEGRLSLLERNFADERASTILALRSIHAHIEEIKVILAKRAEEDASRMGMVKGGWWVLGIVVSAITFASSAATIAWRNWVSG